MRSRSDRTTGINVFQVFLNTSSLCHVTDRGRAFVCSVSSGVQSIFSRQFAFNDAFGALVFLLNSACSFSCCGVEKSGAKVGPYTGIVFAIANRAIV